MKPRLLDLFCGAGGAACGYMRVGFYVVGVDHRPQPNYCGDEFRQADAIEDFWHLVDHYEPQVIHASPPCQANSKLRVLWRDREYRDVIAPVRELLWEADRPYVIENVEGADLPRQPTLDGRYGVELCGSMFGLDVRRHRLFETSFPVVGPACRHDLQGAVVGVYGHTGAGANRGRARANGQTNGIAEWSLAMDIDWMTVDEIAEAIPPTYTAYVGAQLMQTVRQAEASRLEDAQ